MRSIERDPEKVEAAKVSEARHKIAVEKLRSRWRDEGYEPYRHLDLAMAQGDGQVLRGFHWLEARGQRSVNSFPVWLAACDISEAMRVPRIDPEAMAREQTA